VSQLGAIFGPELLAAIERLVDERIALALAEREQPEWLTLEQLAELRHTTPGALRKRANRGRLPGAVRDGARWLVDRRTLEAATAPCGNGGSVS
jgi:hypothetical protein